MNDEPKIRDGHRATLVVAVACTLLAVVSLSFRLVDFDLFARLAVGRLVCRDISVPLSDPFSFTEANGIFIDHEWLSGVIFYLVSMVGGGWGLFGFMVLCMSMTLGLLHIGQRAVTARMAAEVPTLHQSAIVLAVMSVGASPIWNSIVRSHVFTFLGLASYLALYAARPSVVSWRYVVVFPLIMVAWANAHAGFVVGLGFLGCAYLGSLFGGSSAQRKMSGISLGGSILAVLCNPYGVDYIPFVVKAISMPRPLIWEWGVTPLSLKNGLFWITVLIVLVRILAGGVKKLEPCYWLFGAATLVAAVLHQRHTAFFLLFIAAVYPMLACSFPPHAWLKKRLQVLTSSATIALLVVLIWFTGTVVKKSLADGGLRLDTSAFPVDTIDWLLERGYKGRLLTHFNQGSYAIFAGYPTFQVAIDGRYEEVYSESTVALTTAAISPAHKNFLEALHQVNPDVVVLCSQSQSLEDAGRFPKPWNIVYQSQAEQCLALSRVGTQEIGVKNQQVVSWRARF